MRGLYWIVYVHVLNMDMSKLLDVVGKLYVCMYIAFPVRFFLEKGEFRIAE
jgi:hypothetical protein